MQKTLNQLESRLKESLFFFNYQTFYNYYVFFIVANLMIFTIRLTAYLLKKTKNYKLYLSQSQVTTRVTNRSFRFIFIFFLDQFSVKHGAF